MQIFFICHESRRTYFATVANFFFDCTEAFFFCTFWTPRTVCLMSDFKICHRPSGYSFGPIRMKFGILVYLCDA